MLTNFFVNEASSFSSLAEKGNFHTSEPVLRMFRRRNTPSKRSYHLWRNGNIFELCSWDSTSLEY